MKSRTQIKDEAKKLLGPNYGGILGEFILMMGSIYILSYLLPFTIIPLSFFGGRWAPVLVYLLSFAMNFLIFLIYAPLEVGYFDRLKLLWWNQKKQTFFSGFIERRYWRSVVSKILTSIFIYLWSLLLVIPGIIKSIAYSMTPFIISDSQNISALDAINISKKMTNGYKGDIFVFYLSYIGWYLLSILTFGLLAIFYVTPYQYTALGGYYTELKKNALQNGVITLADFGYDE